MSQFIHALDTANKRVKAVNCDSNGNLQVDVVSMTGGGDATAANQVTNHGKLDSVITKLGEIDTVLDAIRDTSGTTGTLEGIRQALLTDVQGKLDHLSDDVDGLEALQTTTNSKLDTLDGSVNTIEGCVSSNELAVSHGALTELAAALNSSKLDVNIASDGASLATSANQSTTNSKLDTIDGSINTIEGCVSSNELAVSHGALTELAAAINSNKVDVSDSDALSALNGIATDVSNSKPDFSQSTLESGSSVTAGSNTSEIDMDGYKHLTIYGSSSVNFGSWCLVRRSTSGGTDFLDGSNIISASDPTGGSNYHLAATFENIGNRYVALRNLDSGAQTVTLFAVRSR